MRVDRRFVFPVLLLVFGCRAAVPAAVAPVASCPAGSSSWVREQIYFGRGMPDGGEVPDSAWQRFLATEIMPRFTDGLTLVEASGRWRSEAGPVIRERSWLLVLYHAADASVDRKVEEVVSAYKAAFSQEAVLRDRDMTCVTL